MFHHHQSVRYNVPSGVRVVVFPGASYQRYLYCTQRCEVERSLSVERPQEVLVFFAGVRGPRYGANGYSTRIEYR